MQRGLSMQRGLAGASGRAAPARVTQRLATGAQRRALLPPAAVAGASGDLDIRLIASDVSEENGACPSGRRRRAGQPLARQTAERASSLPQQSSCADSCACSRALPPALANQRHLSLHGESAPLPAHASLEPLHTNASSPPLPPSRWTARSSTASSS